MIFDSVEISKLPEWDPDAPNGWHIEVLFESQDGVQVDSDVKDRSFISAVLKTWNNIKDWIDQ